MNKFTPLSGFPHVRVSSPDWGIPTIFPSELSSYINRANPISIDLVEFTTVSNRGLITSLGRQSSQQGSTITTQEKYKNSYGRRSGAISSSSWEQATLPQFTTDFTGTKGLTLYARGIIYGQWQNPTNYINASMIYGVTFSGVSGISIGPSTGAFIQSGNNLGASRVCDTIAVSYGIAYDCFLTHPGGDNVFTLEVIGVGKSTSATGGIGGLTITSPVVRTGHNLVSSTPGDKTLIVGAFWQRVLSAEEKIQVANNPYQLINPENDYIYEFDPITGGITFRKRNNIWLIG